MMNAPKEYTIYPKVVPKINLNLIPDAEVQLLAAAVCEAAKKFYADPANVRRFEEWQANREKQQKK
jgi:hypothetical protein